MVRARFGPGTLLWPARSMAPVASAMIPLPGRHPGPVQPIRRGAFRLPVWGSRRALPLFPICVAIQGPVFW